MIWRARTSKSQSSPKRQGNQLISTHGVLLKSGCTKNMEKIYQSLNKSWLWTTEIAGISQVLNFVLAEQKGPSLLCLKVVPLFRQVESIFLQQLSKLIRYEHKPNQNPLFLLYPKSFMIFYDFFCGLNRSLAPMSTVFIGPGTALHSPSGVRSRRAEQELEAMRRSSSVSISGNGQRHMAFLKVDVFNYVRMYSLLLFRSREQKNIFSLKSHDFKFLNSVGNDLKLLLCVCVCFIILSSSQ